MLTSTRGRIRRRWHHIILLVLIALMIWMPRGFGLDRFVTTDEVVWLWRSANFYYALAQGDYSATYQTEHPGVVTMWVEMAAFLLEFPEYRGYGQGLLDKYPLFERLSISKGVHPHTILITSRMIMVLVNTLTLLAAFLLAWRLFGGLPTLVGFGLIAFDPFHIEVTRLAHLDGPLSSFLLLSLLSFLVFLHNGRGKLWLLISAVAGGLAVLSKIMGVMIVPILVLIALVDYVGARKRKSDRPHEGPSNSLSDLIAPLMLWLIVFLIVVVLFFPAMWESPLEATFDLLLTPLRYVGIPPEDILSLGKRNNMESSPRDEFSLHSMDFYLRYLDKYLWLTTPMILIGLMISVAAFIGKFSIFSIGKARRAVVGIIIFVALYTAILSIPARSSAKYHIPVYPLLDLIAGLGWVALTDWIRKFFSFTWGRTLQYMLLIAVLLFQALGALQKYPYYSTYFNPLLGGSRRAGEELFIGSGEGLELASEYLNKKPNAESLKVFSWYGIGPFSYYFVGETTHFKVSDTKWNAELASTLEEMDYLVVYSNQWHRRIPPGLFRVLDKIQPEHRVWIDDIEFARIYGVKSLPPEVFGALE